MPTLETVCVTFLEKYVNSENAFMLLSIARFYDENVRFSSYYLINNVFKRLADKCLEIIDENTQETLESGDFIRIDRETLCMMLARSTLHVKELTLFKAVITC